jgi:hypothetical protein
MTSRDIAQMTPEQIALNILLPVIADTGHLDRQSSSLAHALRPHGIAIPADHETQVEVQAAFDWLIVNGYATRHPQYTGGELALTRLGRRKGG